MGLHSVPESLSQPLTCSTVFPVMNPKAYSPCRGCRTKQHSWNARLDSFSGFKAALT